MAIKYNKIARFQSTYRNSWLFYKQIIKKKREKYFQRTMPFKTAPQRIKYHRFSLIKEAKDLYK